MYFNIQTLIKIAPFIYECKLLICIRSVFLISFEQTYSREFNPSLSLEGEAKFEILESNLRAGMLSGEM